MTWDIAQLGSDYSGLYCTIFTGIHGYMDDIFLHPLAKHPKKYQNLILFYVVPIYSFETSQKAHHIGMDISLYSWA